MRSLLNSNKCYGSVVYKIREIIALLSCDEDSVGVIRPEQWHHLWKSVQMNWKEWGEKLKKIKNQLQKIEPVSVFE